jgi:outer membrane protein assembly factor BamB
MERAPTRRELLRTVGGAVAVATAGTGAASGQSQAATTWQSFGADAGNTGHAPGAAGPRADVGFLWEFPAGGSVEASPAVADVATGTSGRTVYTGSGDGTVHALDPADGSQQWTFQTGGAVRSSPAVDTTDDGGTLYVGSDDGRVYAIDAVSGQQEWTFETGGAVESSPVVIDAPGETETAGARTVYVGSADRNVYAIEAATGDQRWSFETFAPVSVSPAAVAATADGETGTVYVGSEDSVVYALDAPTGDGEWQFSTDGSIQAAPVATDDRVYVASRDGVLYAVDRRGGTRAWTFDTGRALVAAPAVDGRTVYLGGRDGTLHALSTAEGSERWAFDTGQRAVTNGPSVAAETVFVGNDSGALFGVDTDGQQRWQVTLDRRIETTPTVVSTGDDTSTGRVYVGDGTSASGSGGSLYALAEGATGGLLAEESTPMGGGPGGSSGDSVLGEFTFLLFPAAIVTLAAGVVGGLYAASYAGLLDRIEAVADAYGPEPGEFADDDPDDDPDGSTAMWELVVDDVIGRAEQTDRTATEDLLVTRYLDSETLDSPMVAYKIESYRDDSVRVRLTEPVFAERDEDSRPLGDNWVVEDDRLVFDRVLEGEETVQTLVGRPDCPDDRLDDLLDRPEITVDSV